MPDDSNNKSIDRFPDGVLCHVLSFLETKEAVATSVLSKRWTHLWTSVPVLAYDNQIRASFRIAITYSFERFVYATILARDVHQPIRTFRLKYNFFERKCRPIVDICAWLKAVMQRGVENLDIDLRPTYIRKPCLSCCIFSCRTLVTLKLTGLSVNNVSSTELPLLKSLHLVRVEFRGHGSLIDILYRCPILEDLKAHSLSPRSKGESMSLPKLVRADMHQSSLDCPLKITRNVEFLTLYEFSVDHMVPEFPNLTHLVLELFASVSWDLVFEMLKNSPMLQVLDVRSSPCTSEKEFRIYPHYVPECLTSRFRKCSLKDFCGTKIELKFANYIMQNSTALRTMKICCWSKVYQQEKYEMINMLALSPRISPLCELSFD